MSLEQAFETFKQLETALSELEDKARMLVLSLNLTKTGMVFVDKAHKIILSNGKAQEIFGRTKEELETSTFEELTYPDDLQKDLNLLDQVDAGTISSYDLVKRYLMKDDTTKPCWINVGALYDAENKPELYFAVIFSREDLVGIVHKFTEELK